MITLNPPCSFSLVGKAVRRRHRPAPDGPGCSPGRLRSTGRRPERRLVPAPLSATSMRTALPLALGRDPDVGAMFSLGVTAYLIAFSISGCSSSDGSRAPIVSPIDLEMRPQPVLEPHLLDLEVELQRLDLLGQRHLGGRLVDQRVAQERRQPRQHRIGPLGLLQQHQRRDAVQRVEQEVRVELVAQHRQLRGRGLAFQPRALVDLLFQQQIIIDPVIERRPGGEQREIEEDRAEIFDPDRLERRASGRSRSSRSR